MPGDGSEVQTGRVAEGPETNVVEIPTEKPSFKDQVLGYAKVTRGKVRIISYTHDRICLLTSHIRLLAMSVAFNLLNSLNYP
jgi:hypothetical protein